MLLMNKTLIRMARGLWGWMGAIVLCRLLTLVGTASFARTVSGFLGDLTSPAMTLAEAGSAIASALMAAAVILAADLLTGEAEYRCTAKARQSLRTGIFSKALELDVGNIEKIGPVSAITSSVDGVESMQIYYSKYLPGLIYCVIAPFYLFFQLKDSSLPTALVLLAVSLILLPANNLFRKHIESLKTDYWQSMEDLTGYYLESVQGLTTLKLFHQDERRTEVLQDKADRFNNKIMDVMRVNFTSFLFTDGMIYGCVVLAAVTAFCQLAAGSISFSAALMALMLSYSFFGSFRQLMNATHSALAGVAAAEKVEQLLSIDTSRPWNPDLPAEKEPFRGIRLEHISYAYEGRAAALTDISFDGPFRLWKKHRGRHADAFLRSRFGPDSSGRKRLYLHDPGRTAPSYHHGASDRKPFCRYRPGQSADGRPGRRGRTASGSTGSGDAGGLDPFLPGGTRHPGGRFRQPPLRRPAAENRHRPGAAVPGGVHHFR